MTCWPPCNVWCECKNNQCQPKTLELNAVRLRTPDGRYLTAVNGGGAGLTANTGSPSQSATFLLVSRPTEAPLVLSPLATSSIASGSPISLVVCAANWGLSPNLMRVQHTAFQLSAHGLVTHAYGGPDTFVSVSPPFSSGYPGYTSDIEPPEWVFSILKAGGGAINSGDQVSLRIGTGIVGYGPFFFRTTSAANEALTGGDGTAAFQTDTRFFVEFVQVAVGLGVRPPAASIVCQTCGPVTGTVRDATTGVAIAGATVTAQGVLDNHSFSATTDSNGNFRLKDPDGHDCVPPGNVTLRVEAERYQTKVTNSIPDPTAPGGAVVAIALDCTEVRGKVVDDNVPPNPLTLRYVFLTLPNGNMLPPVFTNAIDGTFVFKCVPHGSVELWTEGLAQNQQVNVPPEGKLDVVIVVPVGCVAVKGTVTDGVTGLPICGVRVTAVGSSNADTTDAQGKYLIPCVSPKGSKTLLAVRTGYQTNFLLVANFPTTGTVTQNIILAPTSIPSLFNTGMDNCGNTLSDGTIGDPHYSLVSVPGGTTEIRVRTSVGGYPVPPYIGDNSISAWIGPNNDGQITGPHGEYDYRTTFGLTGFVAGSAVISGKWSSDNEGLRVMLNGANIGTPSTAFTQFELGFAPFSITSGFQPGLNTLDFIVSNDTGPTSLRVEMTSTVTPGP